MASQPDEQMDILRRIEKRLEQIESNQLAKAFQHLDLVELALAFRKEREASFPDNYFSNSAWDILLDLYRAHRRGEKMQLTMVGYDANISKTTALRYLDILMQDGFVYREDDPQDNRRSYAILTQSGADKIKNMFRRFQEIIGQQAEILRDTENDLAFDPAQISQLS